MYRVCSFHYSTSFWCLDKDLYNTEYIYQIQKRIKTLGNNNFFKYQTAINIRYEYTILVTYAVIMSTLHTRSRDLKS